MADCQYADCNVNVFPFIDLFCRFFVMYLINKDETEHTGQVISQSSAVNRTILWCSVFLCLSLILDLLLLLSSVNSNLIISMMIAFHSRFFCFSPCYYFPWLFFFLMMMYTVSHHTCWNWQMYFMTFLLMVLLDDFTSTHIYHKNGLIYAWTLSVRFCLKHIKLFSSEMSLPAFISSSLE